MAPFLSDNSPFVTLGTSSDSTQVFPVTASQPFPNHARRKIWTMKSHQTCSSSEYFASGTSRIAPCGYNPANISDRKHDSCSEFDPGIGRETHKLTDGHIDCFFLIFCGYSYKKVARIYLVGRMGVGRNWNVARHHAFYRNR